ncbi:hypothetical protein BDB00DRAFT_771599, partial [Zychaea mexicana]|uniref:uncharacterized protein n=1 Tax=Zychaea mexicana TaxID=64656 RepID=UPI0022FE629C
LPNADIFRYLGIPFNCRATMDVQELIVHNTRKAITSLNCLISLGLSPTGFTRLLAARIYGQFIRPQMEYGLAIQKPLQKHIKLLEDAQSACLRRFYGSSNRTSSTKVMQHLVNIPPMKLRVAVLQAKLLNRSHWLPDDALLSKLVPRFSVVSTSRYRHLQRTALWQRLPSTEAPFDKKALSHAIRNLYTTDFESTLLGPRAKLLSACRPTLGVDPIVWLPMQYHHRSRLIHWRLGWMPNGRPEAICRNCSDRHHLSRDHVIICLQAHVRLKVPFVILDPISFILNSLPRTRPRSTTTKRYWRSCWPRLTSLLRDIDRLCHEDDLCTEDTDIATTPCNDFLLWLDQTNADSRLSLPSSPSFTP